MERKPSDRIVGDLFPYQWIPPTPASNWEENFHSFINDSVPKDKLERVFGTHSIVKVEEKKKAKKKKLGQKKVESEKNRQKRRKREKEVAQMKSLNQFMYIKK